MAWRTPRFGRAAFPQLMSRAARLDEAHRFLRRLILLMALLSVLLAAGAIALSISENVSYWRGLLWSLDTIATIGSIPEPDSLVGQITKVVLISLGLGTMFYVLVTVTELLVAGDLFGLVEVRRMQQKISQLSDHYLICGFGRVGRQIARDLKAAGATFVVVDPNPEVRDLIAEMNVLHVEGRAFEDETLLEAGIDRARGVITCIDSDAENIFVTLTARGLRPDIEIVARAAEESSERKLIRAGANEVVSPYKASGRTMAKLALEHPAEPGGASQRARQHGAVVSGDGGPGAATSPQQ